MAEAETFDHVYDREATLPAVYLAIVDELVAMVEALADGSVLVYAVPGSPVVAERTVELLVERAEASVELDVEIVPALSFLDLAWVRLGVDPVGPRRAGGRRPALRGRGGRRAGSAAGGAVRLDPRAVGRKAGPRHRRRRRRSTGAPVTVLQRLGLDDEQVFEVAWDELDRAFVPDHLTSRVPA